MEPKSTLAVAAVLLAGALATGCGGGSAQVTTAGGAPQSFPVTGEPDEEQGAGADEVRAFHRHHHMGFIGFALMSIPSLGVSPAEQVAVDKIKADIQAKMQPAHEAEAVLLNVVADGVAAGAIDSAKVAAAIAKITEVSTQMDDATNDALDQLHAALSAPERQALALKVQAHYQIWEKANASEAAHPDQEKEGGHIHHFITVLALTPDQVQKVDAAFTASMAAVVAGRKFDSKAAQEHLDAFTKSFAADQFNAKSLVTADKANSGVTSWGAMRMVKMYEAMTPVLTPEQRTKLAALLRDHSTKTELK